MFAASSHSNAYDGWVAAGDAIARCGKFFRDLRKINLIPRRERIEITLKAAVLSPLSQTQLETGPANRGGQFFDQNEEEFRDVRERSPEIFQPRYP